VLNPDLASYTLRGYLSLALSFTLLRAFRWVFNQTKSMLYLDVLLCVDVHIYLPSFDVH